MPRLLTSFHPRTFPLMARLSYSRELVSWALLPVMLGGIQDGTVAVFVKKTFAGINAVGAGQLNFAVALVSAAQAIGMLTSFFWASAGRGRPKVRLISALQLATAGTVAIIALAPRSAFGMWSVAALCILARMFWTGVTTLRAGVWRANYANTYRSSIFGNLTILHALIVAVVGAAVGLSLDWNPRSYRAIFPIVAVFGALGALAYGWIPFRRETRQLESERAGAATGLRALNPLMIAHVLAGDRWFRNYLTWMFLVGMGNLMIPPILAIVLTDQFDAGYITGIAIMTVIPLVCMTLTIPLWSRRLARQHVIDFRAVHAWVSTIAATLTIAGVATDNISLLFLAAVAIGIGWGGGAPAWNLGHQHFAPRNRDADYMAVHITLTGIRGFLGPLLSVWIYTLLAPHNLQVWAFVACLVINVIGATGFVVVSRKRRAIIENDKRETELAVARAD